MDILFWVPQQAKVHGLSAYTALPSQYQMTASYPAFKLKGLACNPWRSQTSLANKTLGC